MRGGPWHYFFWWKFQDSIQKFGNKKKKRNQFVQVVATKDSGVSLFKLASFLAKIWNVLRKIIASYEKYILTKTHLFPPQKQTNKQTNNNKKKNRGFSACELSVSNIWTESLRYTPFPPSRTALKYCNTSASTDLRIISLRQAPVSMIDKWILTSASSR